MRKFWLGATAIVVVAKMLSAMPIASARAQTAAAGWPHTVAMGQASVTVYQPQAMAWPDQKRLTARAALAITPQGATAPVLGTIELTVATTVDLAACRTRDFRSITTAVRLRRRGHQTAGGAPITS